MTDSTESRHAASWHGTTILSVRKDGRVVVAGEVPLAEINDYASRLKSLTGGRGSYNMEFSRYAEVPPPLQQKMAASFKLKEDEE